MSCVRLFLPIALPFIKTKAHEWLFNRAAFWVRYSTLKAALIAAHKFKRLWQKLLYTRCSGELFLCYSVDWKSKHEHKKKKKSTKNMGVGVGLSESSPLIIESQYLASGWSGLWFIDLQRKGAVTVTQHFWCTTTFPGFAALLTAGYKSVRSSTSCSSFNWGSITFPLLLPHPQLPSPASIWFCPLLLSQQLTFCNINNKNN